MPPKRALSEADAVPDSPDRKRARHGSETGRRSTTKYKPRNHRKRTRKTPVVAPSARASGSNHRLSSSPRPSPERSTAPPSLPTSQVAAGSDLQMHRIIRSRYVMPAPASSPDATFALLPGRAQSPARASASPARDVLHASASSNPPPETRSTTPQLPDKSGSPCARDTPPGSSCSQRVSTLAHLLNPQPIAGPSKQVPEMHQSPSPQDKGKGKATEPHVATDSQLSKELTSQAELIASHEALLAHFQPTLTCQICLDLMHRPFSLAPCGHTSCYTCLVSWFTAPPAVQIPGRPLPLAVNRKKTCPHCRADVRERPIEAWAVKDMVAALVKSGLSKDPLPPAPAAPDGARADPWAGIFKPAPAGGAQHAQGMLDGEDGVYRCYDCMHEIWDGVCSGCGRVYDLDEEEADDLAWLAAHGGAPAEWFDPEDDEDDDGDDGRGAMNAALFDAGGFNPFAWMAHYHAHPSEDEEDEDFAHHADLDDEGDDGYESSFIDDGEGHPPPGPGAEQAGGVIDLTSDDEAPRPRRRRAVVEDDDDDDVEILSSPPPQARGLRGTRVGPIVISDDEEDAEDDVLGEEGGLDVDGGGGSDPEEEDDGSIRRPPMRLMRDGLLVGRLRRDYDDHVDLDSDEPDIDEDDGLDYRERTPPYWEEDEPPYDGYHSEEEDDGFY